MFAQVKSVQTGLKWFVDELALSLFFCSCFVAFVETSAEVAVYDFHLCQLLLL